MEADMETKPKPKPKPETETKTEIQTKAKTEMETETKAAKETKLYLYLGFLIVFSSFATFFSQTDTEHSITASTLEKIYLDAHSVKVCF